MKKLLAVILALAMVMSLAACGSSEKETEAPKDTEAVSEEAGDTEDDTEADTDAEAVPSGVEDGVLTVAMECAYAPYNWSQPDDSNGAVPIAGTNEYANGYDIMIAKMLCEANGWELEVTRSDWDSLVPAVAARTIDATIAGQSMTSERMEVVDFAGPYLYASIVCLTTKDSEFANATCIDDLAGGKCTSQTGTIWYETCLPQIPDADIQGPAADAPSMLMAVASGTVDYVCTDMPTALGALQVYDNLVLLDFSGTDGDFQVSDEEINIGIAIAKDNTVLLDAMNSVLAPMTAEDFNDLMDQAIAIQPIGE